jgi:hypothetical protein
MRLWILKVVLAAAAALVPVAALAAATPTAVPPKASPTVAPTAKSSPTAQPQPQPSPSPTQPPPTPTRPPATPTTAPTTPTAPPVTPTARPGTATAAPAATAATAGQSAVVGAPTAPAAKPTASPAPTSASTPSPTTQSTPKPSVAATPAAHGTVHGYAFYDDNADGVATEEEAGLRGLEVTLVAQNGDQRTAKTAPDGSFAFDALSPGTYHVSVAPPTDHVGTSDLGQDVEVVAGENPPAVAFGMVVPPPEVLMALHAGDEPPPEEGEMTDDQVMALSSVTSLPLRFAEGRDLMNQVGLRVLGDGLVWLGVPFRTQIDGGEFQFVNCGPASLTMVLAGFGLDVGPSQVRDYLNSLIDNYNTDLGTSLDVLSRIARDAGLTPMDLYSDRGGYRNWSTDAVRWHVQHGRPVITLVKYRNLPGHGRSLSEFDHYIVVTGLTPNGFIYNDAAFATTLGYGLEISDIELQYAWENSSIPHHAVALGLNPDRAALSFPELPRRTPLVTAPGRSSRRVAEADEVERPVLTLQPFPKPTGPLITASDRFWQDDIDPEVPSDGVPLGLNMEQAEQPALEPAPGIGSVVPKLLLLIGSLWLAWLAWAFSGMLVSRLPATVYSLQSTVHGLRSTIYRLRSLWPRTVARVDG